MNVIAQAPAAPYCPLPGHDQRRGYTNADNTDVAETIRQHAPIFVSAIQDDYERVLADDWLSAPGGFRG